MTRPEAKVMYGGTLSDQQTAATKRQLLLQEMEGENRLHRCLGRTLSASAWRDYGTGIFILYRRSGNDRTGPAVILSLWCRDSLVRLRAVYAEFASMVPVAAQLHLRLCTLAKSRLILAGIWCSSTRLPPRR